MKRLLSIAILAIGIITSGCSASYTQISEDAADYFEYGPMGKAVYTVVNQSGGPVIMHVGNDPKVYRVEHNATIAIPGKFPEFGYANVEIPISAFAIGDSVRPASTIWRFSSYGSHYGYYSHWTRGQSVHAVLERKLEKRHGYPTTAGLVFTVTPH